MIGYCLENLTNARVALTSLTGTNVMNEATLQRILLSKQEA